MAKLQHTSPTLGDTIVNDDNSVTTDGIANTSAIVDTVDGILRVDVNGNGIIDANPYPILGSIKVTREEGWQGALGYRVVLEDWAEGEVPNAIGMVIYHQPDGENFYYTTGAMLWDSIKEEWYVTCPAGFEPEHEDIHMGFIYGGKNISAFTMHSQWDEQTFSGGGDW